MRVHAGSSGGFSVFFLILPREPDILINSGMSRYFLALYRHTVSAHLPHSGHQVIQ